MTESTNARVRKIISEHLCVEEGEFTDETSISDMNADSLDRVELLMAIEDEFEIEISDDQAEANITDEATIASLSAYVDKVLSGAEKIWAR